ncbi:hypothetical protein ACV229_31345 [Burkholderia sp. MR1-5-21]
MQARPQAESLILLIARQHKLHVQQQAAAADQSSAISKLANDKEVRLYVYRCT